MIKNTILKVDASIGGLGTSREVGLIITAYVDPIIRPIIQYIVPALNFLSKDLTVVTVTRTPTNTPTPNIIIAGR